MAKKKQPRRSRLEELLSTPSILEGTKPSNPKEAFGEAKMALGLVPDTAIIEENLAFLEGALKYGQYNWRVVGVKASTYNRAMERHRKKWWNGQDRDPLTMVLELASVRACCGIIIDAIAAGKFTDDRPPRANIEKSLADAAVIAKHLKELFKDHSPPQYTEREHGAALSYPQSKHVPAGTNCPCPHRLGSFYCAKKSGHTGPHVVRRSPNRTKAAPVNVGTGIKPD